MDIKNILFITAIIIQYNSNAAQVKIDEIFILNYQNNTLFDAEYTRTIQSLINNFHNPKFKFESIYKNLLNYQKQCEYLDQELDALYYLAIMNLFGKGTIQNYDLALKYFSSILKIVIKSQYDYIKNYGINAAYYIALIHFYFCSTNDNYINAAHYFTFAYMQTTEKEIIEQSANFLHKINQMHLKNINLIKNQNYINKN